MYLDKCWSQSHNDPQQRRTLSQIYKSYLFVFIFHSRFKDIKVLTDNQFPTKLVATLRHKMTHNKIQCISDNGGALKSVVFIVFNKVIANRCLQG